MDELILRHLGGEATDVEVHRLDKWRAASPENELHFQEMAALWEGLGRLPRGRAARRPDPQGMMTEAEARRARRSRRAPVRSPWAGYGLAAAASIATIFLGVRLWNAHESPATALSAVESSLVGSGQVVAMTLSDGSYLRASAGTKVQFPAEAGRREVVVEGQAFFAVATADDPFVVRTAEGELTALGTRFEVRAGGDLLRVVVVEGAVEFAGPGGRSEIRAGQVATVRGGGYPEVREVRTVEDVWSLLDWPGGLLAFQRTPLGEVAQQLEHEYKIDVRIEDTLAAARRVTGSFQDASLDDVVDAVCAVTGVRCSRQGDAVVIQGPNR